jgi:hypothetical protein
LYPWRPEEVLHRSSTEVRTAGHSANLAIQVDNIEGSKTDSLAPVGLLAAEASVGHQAGLSVRLLREGEVLPAAFVVVTREVFMAVVALEALTEEAMEEAMEEATGKLKE